LVVDVTVGEILQPTKIGILPDGTTDAGEISEMSSSLDGSFKGIWAKGTNYVPVVGTFSNYGAEYVVYRVQQSDVNPPVNILCSLKRGCKVVVPKP
jgi:hypothetical protein